MLDSEHLAGFEPAYKSFADFGLTTWRKVRKCSAASSGRLFLSDRARISYASRSRVGGDHPPFYGDHPLLSSVGSDYWAVTPNRTVSL